MLASAEECVPDEEEARVDQEADVHHLSEHAQHGMAVVELQIKQLGIWEEKKVGKGSVEEVE